MQNHNMDCIQEDYIDRHLKSTGLQMIPSAQNIAPLCRISFPGYKVNL